MTTSPDLPFALTAAEPTDGVVLARAPWDTDPADLDRDDTVRITGVTTFLTAPQGCPYVIVRVETNVPGLYGLGCSSDPQRTLAIASVVNDYLAPMIIGRPAADIEDIHRLLLNSGYWRGGSIANNALAGIDVALWDIAGKRAGLPLHELFGGRARNGAAAYTHVDGFTAGEIADKVLAATEKGYRHVRVQVAVPGTDTYGTAAADAAEERRRHLREDRWDSLSYLHHVPPVLAEIRSLVGDGVELLHDSHERLTPAQARRFMAEIEPARLFFVEDLLAPEDADHFAEMRLAGSTPLAVGELYTEASQYTRLFTTRSIDFARLRIPTLGGLTTTRKILAAAELFGVRSAPHGPGDVSPLGQAANVAMNVSSHAFGVQEAAGFREATLEVFPGAPVARGGVLYPSTKPGLGVDFDEAAARKYPVTAPGQHDRWALLRASDGAAQRP
ncbi:mannonate dehydratase [Mycetocola sp. BIGb0189]|uniref:enolase C-terminal domain-like protein n=1 Tax=Mycetocola sp. BIGb0189 TaxID=2940604 RepID=UPI002168480C|nr:enolase C-terminal domain-like protein [Mycetocola sp. BIGb0189]MCS4276097.1 mannonate dehydratase [Mycetocola sp. BIGb0189]